MSHGIFIVKLLLKAMKLVSDYGRFANKDNSMIFSNVVWLTDKNDIKLYHLISEIGAKEISNDVSDFLVEG